MIRVQLEDFDIGLELKKLSSGNLGIGGISSFVGLVRDFVGVEKIKGMTLEYYPGMTEKALTAIEREAHKHWALESTLIIHRYGSLKPGDQIVLVCASSAHRKSAIEACHFLIDWLKTKAPFWKCEELPNGSEWVKARDLDIEQTMKWTTRD